MISASVAMAIAVVRAMAPSITMIRIIVVAVIWAVVIDVRVHQVISLFIITLINIRVVDEDLFRYEYPFIERAEFILVENDRFMTRRKGDDLSR